MNQHILDISILSKSFGGVQALSDLSMKVARNKVVGLIGPNGSGKTTFFNVVTGIYKPTTGRVVFEGAEITGMPPQTVYQQGVARTFQRSRLMLPLSIFDNITLGDHRNLHSGFFFNVFKRKAFKAELVKCREKARKLLAIFDPGLSENMDQAVAKLPMIDRRRIEICRALISNPKLLLLDEPSAGMTHDETFSLIRDILRIKEIIDDLTIIIIEHEMSVMERSTDWCVVLNFGQKICEGPYDEVASDPQVQQAYLGVD